MSAFGGEKESGGKEKESAATAAYPDRIDASFNTAESKKDPSLLQLWDVAAWVEREKDIPQPGLCPEVKKAKGIKEIMMNTCMGNETGFNLRRSFQAVYSMAVSAAHQNGNRYPNSASGTPIGTVRYKYLNEGEDELCLCMDISYLRSLPIDFNTRPIKPSEEDYHDMLLEVNYVFINIAKDSQNMNPSEYQTLLNTIRLPDKYKDKGESSVVATSSKGEILLLKRILEHNRKTLTSDYKKKITQEALPPFEIKYHPKWKRSFITTMDLCDETHIRLEIDDAGAVNPTGCFYPDCSSVTRQAVMTCGRCRNVRYCNANCQKADWKRHKKDCIDKAKLGSGFVAIDLSKGVVGDGLHTMALSLQGGDARQSANTGRSDNLHIRPENNLELFKVQTTLGITGIADDAMTGCGLTFVYNRTRSIDLRVAGPDGANNPFGQLPNVIAPGLPLPAAIDVSNGAHKALGKLFNVVSQNFKNRTPGKAYLWASRVDDVLLIHTDIVVKTPNW